MYIQLTRIFLQRFVPLFSQKIQYSLEIYQSSSAHAGHPIRFRHLAEATEAGADV